MKYKLQKQYDDDNMMAYKCKKKKTTFIYWNALKLIRFVWITNDTYSSFVNMLLQYIFKPQINCSVKTF